MKGQYQFKEGFLEAKIQLLNGGSRKPLEFVIAEDMLGLDNLNTLIQFQQNHLTEAVRRKQKNLGGALAHARRALDYHQMVRAQLLELFRRGIRFERVK